MMSDEKQTSVLDGCFFLFLLDFIIKILANSGFSNYLKDAYNIFDVICLFSYALFKMLESLHTIDNVFKSLRFLAAIQPLRAFRFLQYFSFMETIQHVISKTFSDYLPLAIILFVFLYIYTLLGLQIFHKSYIDPSIPYNFQDFFSGFTTCFTIMTLDNWYSFIVAYMPNSNRASIIFFTLTLILFGNFVLLDLFIAAMLNGFEFICLKQNTIKESENYDENLTKMVEKQQSRSSLIRDEGKIMLSSRKTKIYRKMSKYISIISVYWTLKHHKMAKILQSIIKNQVFNYIVYIITWFACFEMIYESYYLNYWNYDTEMTYSILYMNIAINLFFGFDIVIRVFSEGVYDGAKNLITNFPILLEFLYILGFYSDFIFMDKNLLIQVIFQYFQYFKLFYRFH